MGAVHAGRFVAGLGVGATVVVGPIYLSEIVSSLDCIPGIQWLRSKADRQAPASIRGLCICVFSGFVYLGIVLAYFANYGCEVCFYNYRVNI